jgi:PAS domain-containing protein
MGLFSFDKKSSNTPETLSTGVKAGIGSTLPQTKPAQSQPSKNQVDNMHDKLKLQKLEKQYKLQTKELEEHEEYLRKVMEQLSIAVNQKKFADKELNEHEDYLRSLMESYQKLSKSYKWQENEILEHEEYTRNLLESLSTLQKQSQLKDKELEEHEEYLRNLMESYQKLSKSYKWQENEIKESGEYTRNLLESVSALRKQSALKDKEISEHEDYLRKVMENYNQSQKELSEVKRKYNFAENEIKEHENYTREILEQVSALKNKATAAEAKAEEFRKVAEDEKRKNSFREQEIKEQEGYIRTVLEDYTKALKKTRDLNLEISEIDDSTRKFIEKVAPGVKTASFIENELREQENFIRHLAESYSKAEKEKRETELFMQQLEVALKSHEAVQTLDASGNIISVNELWTKINGFSQSEVSGMPDAMYYQYTDNFEKNRVELALNAVKLGKSQNLTLTKLTKNGGAIRVNCAFIPKLNNQKQIAEVVKIETLVTDSQQGNKDVLDILNQVVGDYMFMVKLNDKLQILDCSQSFIDALSVSKSSLIQKPIDELFEPNFDREVNTNDMLEGLSRGRTFKRVFKFIAPNRQIIEVDGKINFIESTNQGKVYLFSGVNQKAQTPNNYQPSKNYASPEYFTGSKTYFESMQNPFEKENLAAIIHLNNNNQITKANEIANQLFNAQEFPLEGKFFSDLLVKTMANKSAYNKLFTVNNVDSAHVMSFHSQTEGVKFINVKVVNKENGQKAVFLNDQSAYYKKALKQANQKRVFAGKPELELPQVSSTEIELALLDE